LRDEAHSSAKLWANGDEGGLGGCMNIIALHLFYCQLSTLWNSYLNMGIAKKPLQVLIAGTV